MFTLLLLVVFSNADRLGFTVFGCICLGFEIYIAELSSATTIQWR